MDRLRDAVLANRDLAFSSALADGRLVPFVVPYSLLGAFFVPVLWLAIPHTHRPWLYRTRWLVAAFVVAFNVNVIRHTSSARIAMSYATGLTAAWGIISNLTLLIWTRPQFDAARAVRVSGSPRPEPAAKESAGEASGLCVGGARQRRQGHVPEAGSTVPSHEEAAFTWQPFPADGPFLQRLGWALDLACSFRGSGKSSSLNTARDES